MSLGLTNQGNKIGGANRSFGETIKALKIAIENVGR
jgi:hypothetical protein